MYVVSGEVAGVAQALKHVFHITIRGSLLVRKLG